MPGWVPRFYIDDSVPRHVWTTLRNMGAELRTVQPGIPGTLASRRSRGGGISGMFWRFLVADDDTVDRFIVRDSDARISLRDAAAVADWEAADSKFTLHCIRDHKNHGYEMNGGLWGGVQGSVPEITALID